jgi:S-adenosylmethionine:diacylglycerol 3-amino-3-carboxypropyl transferase
VRPAGSVESAGGAGGVRFVLGDVVEQLRAGPAGRYDAVTLSNVTDGTTVQFRRRLAAALRYGVRPGGPVVLRGFAATVPLDADLGWRDRTEVDRCPLWGTVSVGTVR